MNKITLSSIVALAASVLAPQIVHSQGTTTYLSNLEQSSAGSLAVGSDSWLAAGFSTGTNADGYLLNSVQLALADATGNPSAFTAMIYNLSPFVGAPEPGSSLGTLSGSLDPVAAGDYTYNPASTLTLSPRTIYFIVLTAGTAVANGAYEWSFAGANSYDPSGAWFTVGDWTSSNGSSWTPPSIGYPQFAISGTPVPEPSTLGLLALGGFLLVWHRRKAKAI